MFRLRKTLVGTKSQLFTGTPLEGSTLSEMKMKPVVVLHKCIKHSVEQKRHKMSISSQQKRRKINNWGCPLPTVHIAQVASKSTHWEFLGKMPSKGIWRYKIPVEQCSRSSLTFCLHYWSILFVTQVFEKDKCASSPPFCQWGVDYPKRDEYFTRWTHHNITFRFWDRAIWAPVTVFSLKIFSTPHCGTLIVVNARAGCVTFNKLLGALVHWLQINYSYWRMLIAGGEKYGVHGGEGNTSNLVWRCGCSSTL